MTSFKFRVVLYRIRLFPTLISKIKWLGSKLPLKNYLGIGEFFGDFDAIDIKYQFFLCNHFLFLFCYLFCKRVTDLYRNWNFSKIFKIFLSERTSKYSFLRCSTPYLNFLFGQIFTNWQTLVGFKLFNKVRICYGF